MAIIKTPDQRVRVFISSTINELADERLAARKAIEQLKLIPVFFEAGARPHPPRDLYSAYLQQSHIFLGIYWNSYGWIAPGAEISGLEDEYRLCEKNKPKLIYVKQSSERQERLNELLDDISKSETACYQKFKDADELYALIQNDLSILMSEIIEHVLYQSQSEPAIAVQEVFQSTRLLEIPIIKSALIGREKDIESVSELLLKDDISLVTLLGAGGTGKTSLSMHIAWHIESKFDDGVLFVPLAALTNSALVMNVIAEKLGIQDSGKQDLETLVISYLSSKKFLLVLDNFEQIVDASVSISNLINHCKQLKILITSRSSLRIRGERIYHLPTLQFPQTDERIPFEKLSEYAATKLFLERAGEVNTGIEETQDNADAILEICQRMDGLPLAIELAAARTRFFQPAALLSRITKTLDLVSKGHKDLPERQQTLRGAIEWSYNLLSPDTQFIFRQIGVFKRSWTIDAADVVLVRPDQTVDTEEYIERLLDVSLIKPDLMQSGAEPRFSMLQTVYEYANELLDLDPKADEVKSRFAHYFLQLCEEAEPHIWGRNGEIWLDRLEMEYANIRASVYYFIQTGMLENAWRFIPCLAHYWTIRGGFSESIRIIQDVGLHDTANWQPGNFDISIQAKALTWGGYCSLFVFEIEKGFAMELAAIQLLEQAADTITLCYACCFYGCYGSYMQLPDCEEVILRGFKLLSEHNDPVIKGMFYCWSDQYYVSIGQTEIRNANLIKASELAKEHGITYILGATFLINATDEMSKDIRDPRKLIDLGEEMFTLFPKKGYKGLKAAAKQFQAFGYLMEKNMVEGRRLILESADFVLQAGEPEGEFYFSMMLILYDSLEGMWEAAIIQYAALQRFLQESQYPLVGAALAQYNILLTYLEPELKNPQSIKWMEAGKQLSLSESNHLGYDVLLNQPQAKPEME